MTQTENLQKWLKAGCQRQAVAQVLTKPMIPSEICAAAKQHAPRIQLRDVWLVLKQMESKSLVSCLTPDVVTGKLFYWTNLGRQIAGKMFSVAFSELLTDIDWNLYSWVIRGSSRKQILLELTKAELDKPEGLTPSEIKRRLRGSVYGISKNQILRALNELKQKRIVNSKPLFQCNGPKMYLISKTCRWMINFTQELFYLSVR